MGITDRRRNLFELLVAPETRQDFFAAIADDVRWTVLGTHPLAGSYSDKRSLLNATFGRLDRLRQGAMQMEIRGLHSDGDVVAAELSAGPRRSMAPPLITTSSGSAASRAT